MTHFYGTIKKKQKGNLMRYRIAICDDEIICAENILKAISDYEKKCYESPLQLLDDVKNRSYLPDIIFTDIVFENENGIDVIKEIQKINGGAKVIYISGYPNYAERIFETEPVAFLLKPITPERVVAALEKAVKLLDKSEKKTVNIKTPAAVHRINKDEVLYIESKARKLNIVLLDQVVEIYAKLSDIAPQFSDFCRCHQSFLVNYKHVISLNHRAITLSNGTVIPVSKARYNGVKNDFAVYLGGLI